MTYPSNARTAFSTLLGWMIYFERNGVSMADGPFRSEHAAFDHLVAHRDCGTVESFGPRRRAWGRKI